MVGGCVNFPVFRGGYFVSRFSDGCKEVLCALGGPLFNIGVRFEAAPTHRLLALSTANELDRFDVG